MAKKSLMANVILSPAVASELAIRLEPLSLTERLAAIAERPGRHIFTTSLGIEDQAITHAIFSQNLRIDVVTLDTGRLFPETYGLWAETEQRYGHRIQGYFPDGTAVETLIAKDGVNGFRQSIDARKACCHVRKVVPLERALGGADTWITGLRASQSATRSDIAFAELDAGRGLVKVNPLLDWEREQVFAYVRQHNVPYNPLHDQGFLSIGCAPCTRAIAPGEPERAGRWWWEDEHNKECGLHVDDSGRLVRATPPVRTALHG